MIPNQTEMPPERRPVRPEFDDLVDRFRRGLVELGWPSGITWVQRGRVVFWRRRWWVFRPEQLIDDAISRASYERLAGTPTTIHVEAIGRLGGRTVACIDDYGGDSGYTSTKYPVGLSIRPVCAVRSRGVWWGICRFASISGVPQGGLTAITPSAC